MATNILASRLAQLVQTGMLAKKPYATDRWITMVKADKAKLISRIRETVQGVSSIFVGPESVGSTLGVANE